MLAHKEACVINQVGRRPAWTVGDRYHGRRWRNQQRPAGRVRQVHRERLGPFRKGVPVNQHNESLLCLARRETHSAGSSGEVATRGSETVKFSAFVPVSPSLIEGSLIDREG